MHGRSRTLEPNGAGLVGKLNHDVDLPWPMARRVGTPAVVVIGEASIHVSGETNREVLTPCSVLQDVHEPFGSHGSRGRKPPACRRPKVKPGFGAYELRVRRCCTNESGRVRRFLSGGPFVWTTPPAGSSAWLAEPKLVL
jgi:hypothetical protein